MIRYACNPQLDFGAVLDLYASVGWSNYTNHPQQLEQAFHQSLFVMAAYDDEELVDSSGRRWAYHCLHSGFVGISAVPASGDWPEPSSADVGKI